MSAPKPKFGLLRKFLLAAVAAVVALFALEWTIRVYFPVGGQIYVIDEGLLYDAKPRAARIQRMGEAYLGEGDAARVHVRTGVERYRGGDLEAPKTKRRVLVLGDSLVMAENVPVEATFVKALGRELEARLGAGGAIETVNAGRSGYGPDQSLLLLERDAKAVNPDLVVCVLCAHNDFGDLMRNKLFRSDSNGTLQRETPRLGARMRTRFAEVERSSQKLALQRLWEFRRQAQGAPVTMEPLPSGTMRLYVTALESQAREHLVDRNDEVVSLFEDVYDIDVAADLEGSFARDKRALMTAVLARMIRFTDSLDLPIVFVVVPSAVDVCDNFGICVDPLQFPDHSPARLADALVGAVGLAGGVAIDVTPVFLDAGGADRYFVGGTDMHWNAAGQGAAASYVAEELLRDTAALDALKPKGGPKTKGALATKGDR